MIIQAKQKRAWSALGWVTATRYPIQYVIQVQEGILQTGCFLSIRLQIVYYIRFVNTFYTELMRFCTWLWFKGVILSSNCHSRAISIHIYPIFPPNVTLNQNMRWFYYAKLYIQIRFINHMISIDQSLRVWSKEKTYTITNDVWMNVKAFPSKVLTIQDGNIGNCHPEKTTVDWG